MENSEKESKTEILEDGCGSGMSDRLEGGQTETTRERRWFVLCVNLRRLQNPVTYSLKYCC